MPNNPKASKHPRTEVRNRAMRKARLKLERHSSTRAGRCGDEYTKEQRSGKLEWCVTAPGDQSDAPKKWDEKVKARAMWDGLTPAERY